MGRNIDVSDEHPEKAKLPIDEVVSGMLTVVRELQLWNAPSSMSVTSLGIITEVSEEQPWNERYPILVTGIPSITPGTIRRPDAAVLQSVMVTLFSEIV